MTLSTFVSDPERERREYCEDYDQHIETKARVDHIEDRFREPLVSHPGLAVVSKGEKVGPRYGVSVDDVLARFQVPPKISITQRPGRKEKGVGKDVNRKKRAEGAIQAH